MLAIVRKRPSASASRSLEVGRADPRRIGTPRELLELGMRVGVGERIGMTDFGAVESIDDELEPWPEKLARVCGDRNAALAMNLVDLIADRQRGIDRCVEADCDHVLRDLGNLLADEHDRAADLLREPASPPRVLRLAMPGDGEGIEPLIPRLDHQPPGRQ